MSERETKPSCELWCEVDEQRAVARAVHAATAKYPVLIPSGRAGVLFIIDGMDETAAQKLLRSVRQGHPSLQERERQCV